MLIEKKNMESGEENLGEVEGGKIIWSKDIIILIQKFMYWIWIDIFCFVCETMQYTEYLRCVYNTLTSCSISRQPIEFREMPMGFTELYIRTKASED